MNIPPLSTSSCFYRLGFCAALLAFAPAAMIVFAGLPSWLQNLPLPSAPLDAALMAGAITLISAATLSLSATRHLPSANEGLRAVLVTAALTMASSGHVAIWQAPGNWADLLRLSPLCAAFISMAQISLLAVSLSRRGRYPSLLAQCSLLAMPFAFNWLLVLQTPGLLQQMGALLPGSGLLGSRGHELCGRVLVLSGFNLGTILILNALCIRTIMHEPRTWVVLLASATFAGLTPLAADLGSGGHIAALPPLVGICAAILSVALAQAGLWGQTFLLTGLFMDALKGRRPTGYWGAHYFRDGLGKGAVYGALFLGLLFLLDGLARTSIANAALMAQPLLLHLALGALFMPVAKTLLESFDGCQPFFSRLADSALQPHLYLRGAISGCGLYIIPLQHLMLQSPGDRFLLGAGIGALVYAGGNALVDALEIARGKRLHLQSWRVHLNGALLGGFVGGALAWYLDPSQSAAVLGKFRLYVTLHVPGAGDYVIYPLFSKWGAMNLGTHAGSARILFNESLSGVINWSLAAPLFSVNFFFLAALFARSWAPVRRLFSREGLIAVAEQTVRVLRWGLWMAPVIYSLLRISPDPSWYNQDGAIRTAAAIWQNMTLTPGAFREWSIQTFLYLLAYDWFRILIWFDHMGLRVATLVNLSFVGGDALDEMLARFKGHPGRTRCIPEALRRFATWAPLLIPFFLPMGADWAFVWDGAEAIQNTGQGQAAPMALLLALFVGTALAISLFGFRKISLPDSASTTPEPPGLAQDIILRNGVYTSVMTAEGRGYSRVFSALNHGKELDLTNRPLSPMHNAGKFLYLREEGSPPWSMGSRPVRRDDARTSTCSTGPLSCRLECDCQGIEARTDILVPQKHSAEIWRIRLTNTQAGPRRLELTSYREICLNDPNPQLRHPFYNRLHIATWFVPELNAVFSANRMLKTLPTDPAHSRPSPEVFFHAAHIPDQARASLAGYEDSRTDFLGHGTLNAPEGLTRPPRDPADRDLHYTFDPMASLRIIVDLEPRGSVEILLADGYAPSAAQGAQMLREILGLPDSGTVQAPALKRRSRAIKEASPRDMLHPTPETLFSFSDDGEKLFLSWKTPRLWAHLLVNELGYGTLANSDGSFCSFMGNSQQNAITPFGPDAKATQDPGQIIYLRDTDTGELSSPTFIPYRDRAAAADVTFGLGHCAFRQSRGTITTELTAFVLHDQPMEARLLRIINGGEKSVTFTVTFFAHMVLAETPLDSAGQITVEQSAKALFFQRPDNPFQQGCAFVGASLPLSCTETSLNRFLGEGRTLCDPHMVVFGEPDSKQKDGGGTVAALAWSITVPPGGESSMHVMIGQTRDAGTARQLMAALTRTEDVLAALGRTRSWWQELLGRTRVETDSPAFDRLVNIWLPYQLLTARLWGRLGPQQRSGAFGFRDQLQDVLPLVLSHPDRARAQILLHARQQFLSGDVLQWWHQTPEGRTGLGMRNRASDPHLWLAYMTCRYVEATGDRSILEESIPYLEGQEIPRGQEGIAFVPRTSRDEEPLLGHCLRAVDLTLSRMGSNGLPLMAAHDWNDGLSAVGLKGAGTSVWLGFLLHDVLRSIAMLTGPSRHAQKYEAHATRLGAALQEMWREDHFVRAVRDNGEILDYADALCASWPLLSGAVDPEQGEKALLSGLERLEKENMVLLLDPFFDENSHPYPGRIADYPPGVRENGAQYSHGASWMVDALTSLALRAAQNGDTAEALRRREDALRIWLKISPLAHTCSEELDIYGLPPHQQPADIYSGPGYEGRGGWSWYTGAAARMLWAAYGIVGMGMRDGRPQLDATLLHAEGTLRVRRIRMNGKDVFIKKKQEDE